MSQLSQIFLLLSLALILIMQACKKDDAVIAKPELGYDYYPIQVGSFWIYEVDSIVYDDFTQQVDTFNYQLMEFVESEFLDQENRINFRMERHKRTKPQDTWKIADVGFVCKTNIQLEKTANNLKVIPLIFPIKEGLTWNGNAYNTNEVWNYKLEDVDKQLVIGNLSFDSTITVIQRDEFNLIETQYYLEQYAKNTGLVHKKIEDLKTDVKGKIKSGVKYSQRIVEFGIKK